MSVRNNNSRRPFQGIQSTWLMLFGIFFLALNIIIAFFGSSVVQADEPHTPQQSFEDGRIEAAVNMPILLQAYSSRHALLSPPLGWYGSDVLNEGVEKTAQTRMRRITGLYDRMRTVSEEATIIHTYTQSFAPFLFNEVTWEYIPVEIDQSPPSDGAMPLGILSEQHAKTCPSGQHPLVDFQPTTGVTTLSAYEVSDLWVVAMLYREIGRAQILHIFMMEALQHPNLDSVYDVALNEAYLALVVDAVLMQGTDGKLSKLYESIVQRAGPRANAYQAIAAATPEDLQKFDALIGTSFASRGATWDVPWHFLFGLGASTMGGDVGVHEGHVELIRWLAPQPESQPTRTYTF